MAKNSQSSQNKYSMALRLVVALSAALIASSTAYGDADGTSTTTATTNVDGEYSISVSASSSGDYIVSADKQGGVTNGISSLDAAYILQASVGVTELDEYQRLACDVSGNGSCSSLDASLILQYSAGLITQFPVQESCGSLWHFIPIDSDEIGRVDWPVLSTGSCEKAKATLTAPPSRSIDFKAVVMGDVTGNWKP